MNKVIITLTDKTKITTKYDWSIPDVGEFNDTRKNFIEIGNYILLKDSILNIEKVEEEEKWKKIN